MTRSAQSKKAAGIPFIGNGDFDSAQKAREVFDYANADGIIICRAPRGRRWIFNQVNSYLNDNTQLTDLPLTRVRDIILAHLGSLCFSCGEFTGVRVGRKTPDLASKEPGRMASLSRTDCARRAGDAGNSSALEHFLNNSHAKRAWAFAGRTQCLERQARKEPPLEKREEARRLPAWEWETSH